MLHLPLDGSLLVALLILLLLGGIRLVGDAGDFHELIQRLFDQFRPPGPAVLGQDGIALLIGDLQQGRHDAGGHADGIDLFDKILRRLRPLKASGIAAHLPDERLELFLLLRRVKVLRIPAAGGHEPDGMVGINTHILQIHAVLCADHAIAVLVEFCDVSGNADGVEVALGQLRVSLVLLCHDHNDLFPDGDAARPGVPAQLIERIKQRGVGREDHIIGRYNYHFPFLLL